MALQEHGFGLSTKPSHVKSNETKNYILQQGIG